jgi:hypothetical protein
MEFLLTWQLVFLFQSNPEVVLKIEVFSLEMHRFVRKRERIHEMQNFIEKKCQYMGRQFTIEEKKEPKRINNLKPIQTILFFKPLHCNFGLYIQLDSRVHFGISEFFSVSPHSV